MMVASDTIQNMNFRTEADMLSAIDWLENNQTETTDYVIQDQGQVSGQDYYFLTIWFASLNPLAIGYYNGVGDLVYDPYAEPEEDPPEG